MVVQRGLQINFHITTPLSEIIQRKDKGNLRTCKQQYSKSRFNCSLILNLIAKTANLVNLMMWTYQFSGQLWVFFYCLSHNRQCTYYLSKPFLSNQLTAHTSQVHYCVVYCILVCRRVTYSPTLEFETKMLSEYSSLFPVNY